MDWLKSLGERNRPLDDAWRDTRSDVVNYVRSKRRMSMKPGDGIAYYATTWGSVFAVGVVTSFAYELPTVEDEDYIWRVDVRLDHAREFVHDGAALDVVSVAGRHLPASIKQKSQIRLAPEEFAAIIAALAS
jgi:hypothetical protein